MKTLSAQKQFITIFMGLSVACLIQAQSLDIQNKLKQFGPVSPQSAKLMQEIDYPINYSTGSINLTIPIYTIKTRDFTLPITLKCNTSGIKQGEHSGWVALGWTLDAEPIITREMKGGADEGSFGYVAYNSRFGTGANEFVSLLAPWGGVDEQPDILSCTGKG